MHANGAPVTIVLAYLDGVSTWGPRNATGISEFVARESELRLIASGLPQLSGEEYRVWIKNVSSGQQMALASFNSGADGRASLDVVLDMTIPDAGWNLMLLSVEEPGSTPAEPGPRRTLAGRWPVATGAQGRPAELPRTGGEASWNLDPDAAPGLALVVAALTVGVAVGFGVRHGRRMTGGRAP